MATTNGVAASFLYDVLTLAEAAAYLKLPEQLVRAEADQGRLVGRAVGDDWRFSRDELIRWVKPQHLSAPPSPQWTAETEAECEAFIAEIYAARKALGTVGDRFPDEEAE
jgi:excisionase family DNA binding protein